MSFRINASFIALPFCLLTACAADPGDQPEAQDPEPAATVSTAPAQHCVLSAAGEASCYATFTEAISVATGGAITDAPADAHAAAVDPIFTARLDALGSVAPAKASGSAFRPGFGGPVIIGIVWKDANFQGDTWIFNEPWGCSSGDPRYPDFEAPNLNDPPFSWYGFNDVISSFRTYAGCTTVLYADWKGLGAALFGWEMSYVGDPMNDRASSIRWF